LNVEQVECKDFMPIIIGDWGVPFLNDTIRMYSLNAGDFEPMANISTNDVYHPKTKYYN
jgi:hypothetical protein